MKYSINKCIFIISIQKAEDKSGISSNLSFNEGNLIGTTFSL